MTVVKFLKNEVERLTINDLLAFFVEEEICENHREQLLGLNMEVPYKRQQVVVQETEEEWTVISNASDDKLLLLFSNTSKVVFFNKSIIVGLAVNEFVRVHELNRHFYLISGMYNNTGRTEIEDYKVIDSVYFNRLVKRHLFYKINQEFTKVNQETLIKEGLKDFEQLPYYRKEADLKQWKDDALNLFLCNRKPREVLFHLETDFSGVEEFLTTENVLTTFEYINRGEKNLEKIKKQGRVSYYELQNNFRAFMTQELYRQHEAEWLENKDYLAVREISKLEQEGRLNQKGKLGNEPIHMEVILKGKSSRSEAWITPPTKSQGYRFQKSVSPLTFSLKRYAPTNDFLPFSSIRTIFVDGCEVFNYDTFITALEVRSEFDEELAKENSPTPKKASTKVKALIVEATENLSKKTKMVEGQLALNLF